MIPAAVALQERLEAAKALAEQQTGQDAAAAEQLRDVNQKYFDALEQLHAERGRVANLQVGYSKQAAAAIDSMLQGYAWIEGPASATVSTAWQQRASGF